MRKKTDKKSPAREVNSSQLAAVTGGDTTAATKLREKAGDIKDKLESVATDMSSF